MRLMCLTLFVALTAMAQVDPEYVVPKKNPFATAADLKNGQQLFMGQCARCHGSKGEGGRGAVLAQPRLRHAPDDESLFIVIRDGIKGTEMPGGYALDTRETWQLAAYVRSLGRMAPGKLLEIRNAVRSCTGPRDAAPNVTSMAGWVEVWAPSSLKLARVAAPRTCAQRSSIRHPHCRKTSYRCERSPRMAKPSWASGSMKTRSAFKCAI